MASTESRLSIVIGLVLGLLFIGGGVFVRNLQTRDAVTRREARGTIVDHQSRRESNGDTALTAEVDEDGETHSNSYFTRVAEHTEFARQAQVETCRRQITKSTAVCAVNDGAEWIPPVIDVLRPDAERILDFLSITGHIPHRRQAKFPTRQTMWFW